MQRRTLMQLAILQAYALILANLQSLGGVRTDEAKYVLNIPYPHPPLGRWVFHAFEWLPFQEMFWRVVLATLLVQAVWLVWDRARSLPFASRAAVAGAWLFSGGVLLQAGSIMLSSVVALEAMVLVWLLGRPEVVKRHVPLVSLLWLLMLFTSYQGFLFLPLVWMLVRRGGSSWKESVMLTGAPVALLVLYTLSNPFALATMVIHTDEGAALTLMERLGGIGGLWLLGGAGVVSVVGVLGILRAPSIGVIGSFGLIAAYVFFSLPYLFYAILFTPLLVEGVHALLARRQHPPAFPLLACMGASALVTFLLFHPPFAPGPARDVLSALKAKGHTGSLLLVGSFGHDWQYESTAPVLKWSEKMTADLDPYTIVCVEECPRSVVQGRDVLHVGEIEVYVRQK